jgi:pre-mRNA-splicing factor ATP-dependent RNA helicase DHX15/PRP43
MDDRSKKKQRTEGGQGGGINPHTGRAYSAKYHEILNKRKDLPVWRQQQDFTDMLSKKQTLILVGETGSGKTTQVPQFVVDAGYTGEGKMCVCTQPRRVAAMSVARRVAEEMDVEIGEEVGYSIRFEECTGPRTFLKYSTDGACRCETTQQPNNLAGFPLESLTAVLFVF